MTIIKHHTNIKRFERIVELHINAQHLANNLKLTEVTLEHYYEGKILEVKKHIVRNTKHITNIARYLAYHNKLYNNSEPVISDEYYDGYKRIYYQLVDINHEYRSIIINLEKQIQEASRHLRDLNLFSIGIDLSSTKFQKITHESPMLSLGNVFNKEELEDFIKRINNFLNTQNAQYEFTAEKKIDGVSFSALYKKGKLVHVLTRGDGQIGENITENVLTISGFPIEVDILETVEIRGEIYMLNRDFETLNENNKKNGEKVFANPRNAASGSLRQLNASVTAERKLQYFVYSMIGFGNAIQTQAQIYETLQHNGFIVNNYMVCGSVEEMLEYYNGVAKQRFEIGFDIDGIVYKINSIAMQRRLGMTANAPRWAIAHKFSAKFGETKITEITMQVGRTGIITPVAELLPINLGGVIVKRATLHNKDEIARLGINIGDIVFVERAGDVIPKITSVVRKAGSEIFKFPANCPCCNSSLIQTDALVRCNNILHCSEQILGRMQYFVSKDCFNIVGLGEKQIEELYRKNIIKRYCDIFTLPNKIAEIDLVSWEGWGELSVRKLIESINRSKNISLSRFITALGIYGIGVENAKTLAIFFGKGSALVRDILAEQLLEIDGIGNKTAQEVALYLQNNRNELSMLLTLVNVEDCVLGNVKNQTILFTGMLSISRQEAKDLAQKAGFAIASSINKQLNYLVVGNDAGAKLKKAQELGIQILTEQEFIKVVSL